LADPNHTGLFTYGTRFFAGRFATMMFGLPAAAYAMYRSLPKKRRKKNGGLYFSGALTSFLTGITEPLEYTFLFVAPWLYVIHAFLDGLSFYFADIMNIRIGNSFSGGLIDYLLFGVLQGQDKTHWMLIIPFGLAWAVIYYAVFRFCITHFRVMIPGMGDDSEVALDDEPATSLAGGTADSPKTASADQGLAEQSMQIIHALGGHQNIESVEACATRLRVAVADSAKVDKAKMKQLGAIAVLEVSGGVQAVFGGKSDLYSQEINAILGIDG
ncbi:MAG TPA: PTS glucose transporter subunit IIBC, partial [Lactobacillus sp.]|nr:PTS glucose transporter subunit IIBC [Lactobacillus sp.]